MELDKAIQILREIKKPSEATDQFLHVDLGLIASDKVSQYENALKIVYKNIYEGKITREEVRDKLFNV